MLAAVVGTATGSVLYGVRASDPLSWLMAAAVLIGVSAVANVVPALKASRVEPSQGRQSLALTFPKHRKNSRDPYWDSGC